MILSPEPEAAEENGNILRVKRDLPLTLGGELF